MEIVEKSIDELIPYENNPRINDNAVDTVARSISEFGFRTPIIIDRQNVIVAGHTRLKAAKKLKLKKVPCIIADDLTDEQLRAFRLVDNKAAELSTWDYEKLEIELASIGELKMLDFGFLDTTETQSTIENEIDPEDDPEFDDIERQEKHYGVPYQGNKSRIADIIINVLPAGKRLVDLFGGGGAITHCAMLSGKWESFLYNDINPLITGLFMDAINGKCKDENRVITREEFFRLVDKDAVVKYCWSFGNDGKSYLWHKDDEEIKCQACRVILGADPEERRMAYMEFCRMIPEHVKGSLARLQPLEHLQVLTRLEALKRLEALNIDYRDYEYKEGDVVYCDIPYEKMGDNMSGYGMDFDNKAFYEWVKAADFPVYFSSYDISDKSFHRKKIKSLMALKGASTNGQKVTEYLYSNKPF